MYILLPINTLDDLTVLFSRCLYSIAKNQPLVAAEKCSEVLEMLKVAVSTDQDRSQLFVSIRVLVPYFLMMR